MSCLRQPVTPPSTTGRRGRLCRFADRRGVLRRRSRRVRDVDLDPVFIIHGYPTCSYDWRRRRSRARARDGACVAARPARVRALGQARHCATRSAATPTRSRRSSTVLRLRAASRSITHDMGNTVGGELLAARPRRDAAVRRRRARTHQRQHLHRDGAAHGWPGVPARVARRTNARRSGCSTRTASRRGSPRSARPSISRRRRSSAHCGHSWRTTTATRCWRARFATSRTAEPRRHGSPAQSSRTRRRSASCGGRSTRSPCTR